MFHMIKKITHLLLNEYILLTIIIFGAFGVRLYKISNPIADWHSFRQADTASVSRIYVEEGINLLYPRYYDVSSIQSGIPNPKGYRLVEFPIYNVIHALLAKSFPAISLEVWGRLLSITLSLISTVFIFLIGKRFLGKLGGLLAAFFFAFLPYNIYYSRVILPEPIAVVFGLAAIWFFIKFIDKEKTFHLLFSAFWFALSLLIKPFMIFYSLPLIYLLLDKYSLAALMKNGKFLIKLTLYSAIMVTPLLLWRIWINRYPEGIPFFEWAFNGDNIRFRPAFWRWIFGERLGNLILGIWGIFPFLVGIVTKSKKYFIQFFFLSQVIYMSVVATASVKHDYYQIFIIPAVALAIAQGIVFLVNSEKINQWIVRFVLVFATLMMFGFSFYQVKEYYKINHPEIIAAGDVVKRLTPKDARIVAPYNGDTAFLYQMDRYGWPAVEDSFDNIIKRGADYYVSVSFNDTDTKYILSKYQIVEKTDSYVIADLHKPIKK
ncbi:hypothetical protein A2Z67_03950 [Candidatus Woesebacteria bacterium RBG_13_36_22]|uniref:Glycosyltransferase RgtA/B/C/D-like domain-containing protein n=2 Tax=Candidatus Woeseibacteriota TaxID=1752722 RepID=A0A1F7X7W2_9BACT|nr:MAG: hypothetical protein A2Z67_03950 [Candidatus Woesebacteria bacterium RBG_13_36_22]